jgi:hypothetical protein
MPQRIFFENYNQSITISSDPPLSLSGKKIYIDLGVTGTDTLEGYVNVPILQLVDGGYSGPTMADIIEDRFSLGNATSKGSPSTEIPITTGYKIDDDGKFVTDP